MESVFNVDINEGCWTSKKRALRAAILWIEISLMKIVGNTKEFSTEGNRF